MLPWVKNAVSEPLLTIVMVIVPVVNDDPWLGDAVNLIVWVVFVLVPAVALCRTTSTVPVDTCW